LVEPTWLEPRLADPGIRVIEASWYLPAMKRSARAEYAVSHLPGAVFLDLETDLAKPRARLRNTIDSPESLARTFAARGIGTAHHVIVYDRLGGYSAGRVWWSLRYAGHSNVSLLDGGFERWLAEGRPVTAKLPSHGTATFIAAPRRELLATKADLLRALQTGRPQIVDARSSARFAGTGEEHTKHKGHIPGSKSLPYDQNLAGDPPRLQSLDSLRATYKKAGVRLDRPIIVTCGSGVTAALDAFALALLGKDDVAVYDGSWAEWGDSDDVPIAVGDA
jgi:thiosulfate/3-mercaptopyruvate sulfurtransferase